jgi:hypothetical protein
VAEAATIDLSEIGFVHRITVGSNNPDQPQFEVEAHAAMALLNRCLGDSPKGRILGIEKAFTVLNVGEHQVVLQAMTYHIGFRRRPLWLPEAQR